MNVTVKENEQVTEIVCVIDKSGSMYSIKTDSIGGYNAFLNEQKKLPGKALFSMTLFDTEYNRVYNGENISNVEELNERTYIPGGMTALYDAIGKTINEVEQRHNKLKVEDLPDKVLFIILTDGQENSSLEYSQSQIFELISKKREGNWEFIFLGADESAMETGSRMGIAVSNTMSYQATSRGITDTYSKMSNMSKKFRSSSKLNYDTLADEEKEEENKNV